MLLGNEQKLLGPSLHGFIRPASAAQNWEWSSQTL
jgi:hypothetical protein